MNWKFWSAGRIIGSRQIFLLLILPWIFCCNRPAPQTQDPRLTQLQNDVRKLSEENRRLQQEIENLRRQQNETQTASVVLPEPEKSITIEQMKKEVAPILKETIERMKKASETPKSGTQFGMRVEYDLKNAVYGLVAGDEALEPSAKVIVKFEKFLESESTSRSYGSGSSIFVFAFRNGQWVLQSYQ